MYTVTNSSAFGPIPAEPPQLANIPNGRWTKKTVASILWEDPYAILEDSIVAKINAVDEYLSKFGFELRGIKADGNCFFTAFYQSYRTLKTKIPLIDEQAVPINYLRETLADLTAQTDLNASDRMRMTKQWVNVDEGKPLIKQFGIPIRVITVELEEQNEKYGISDMLINIEASTNWDHLRQNERPKEYIFMVDLSGHFLFANLSENADVQVHSPRSVPLLTDILMTSQSGMLDGFFVPKSSSQNYMPSSEDHAMLGVSLSSEAGQKLSFKVCENLSDDPALLLSVIDQFQLPPIAKVHLKNTALKQMVESADTDVHEAQKGNLDGVRLAELMQKREQLATERIDIRGEGQRLAKEWNEMVAKYYDSALILLVAGPDDGRAERFFDLFSQMKKKQPFSLLPYYPILTFLASRIDQESFESLLVEAQERNYFIGYALTLSFFYLMFVAKNEFFLPGSADLDILHSLSQVYPDDIVVPALIHSITEQSDTANINCEQVCHSLQHSLQCLHRNRTSQAVQNLIAAVHTFPGCSLLHRFLAMCWIMHGGFKQAREVYDRSKKLFDIVNLKPSKDLFNLIMEIVRSFAPVANKNDASKNEDAVPQPADPLSAFFALAEKEPFDLGLAKAFVDASAFALEANADELPIIYFGIRHIVARFVPKSNQFDELYRPLFNSLFALITRTAWIHFLHIEIDPWIAERFEKQVSGNKFSFIVSFPLMQFGFSSTQDEQVPEFKFVGNLRLSDDSTTSVAAAASKKIYSLILSLMCSNVVAKKGTLFANLPLPDDPTLLMSILHEGLVSHESSKFQSAVWYLRSYLEIEHDRRPYPMHPEFLNWAMFCVFATEKPVFHAICLYQEIKSCFYPADFTKEGFQSSLMKVIEMKRFLFETKSSLVHLAIRDSVLAQAQLGIRSRNKAKTVENNNLYMYVGLAKQLFGWQLDETFAEWGSRLAAFNESRFFGADAEFPSCAVNPSESLTSSVILEGNLDRTTRRILGFFLLFWLDFYNITQQKNDHIASGGDEDDSGKKNRQWHEGFDQSKWLKIVKDNKPAEHPNYKTFSKEERTQLEAVIQSKRVHLAEVQDLVKLCQRPGYVDGSEFIGILAAALIVNAEYDRKVAHHSVFVGSEAEARLLYQILLEVSFDRLIRQALVTAGNDFWIESDPKKIRDFLSPILNLLIGKFHGPERHLTGSAPIEFHYNAGIITSGSKPANVHIFFSFP